MVPLSTAYGLKEIELKTTKVQRKKKTTAEIIILKTLCLESRHRDWTFCC